MKILKIKLHGKEVQALMDTKTELINLNHLVNYMPILFDDMEVYIDDSFDAISMEFLVNCLSKNNLRVMIFHILFFIINVNTIKTHTLLKI